MPETAGELDLAAPAFPVGFPHKHKGFRTRFVWVPGLSPWDLLCSYADLGHLEQKSTAVHS